MPAVSRLFPPLAFALREVWREGYRLRDLRADLLAGVTVGVVAVPLSMALAIAIGVAPQYGLYTAIVAGILIALAGGSRYNISGPTAAFVVILHPIVIQHGLGGLLLAGLMAGVLLVAMGWGRLGQFIEYIPHPVTTGFTAGIALVIASLQIKDLMGLELAAASEHFLPRLWVLSGALRTLQWEELGLGLSTLVLLFLWPRLRTPIPPLLVGVVFAGVTTWLLRHYWPEFDITTIGDRFSYMQNGEPARGIPPVLPVLGWPWQLPGADGQPLEISFGLFRALMGPAFAIAILGAIESLLCAVVADGMTGRKHDPNSELVAQGLGNLIVPFFGGIPATAALARTATNVRSGARSPLASVAHAGFVLAAMLLLAPLLAWLPMCALAAMLLVVAWNMSELHHFRRILRVAPRSDVAVLLTCFGLTVLFDMVIAITVGVVLASLLFMHRMAKLSLVRVVASGESTQVGDLPPGVRFYEVAGPLFFGAAEQAMMALRETDPNIRAVLVDLSRVPTIDMTGLVELEGVIEDLNEAGLFVALCSAQRNVLKVLLDFGYRRDPAKLWYYRSVAQALERLREKYAAPAAGVAATTTHSR